jgi:LmbE family N-acetylglucosaminyl deacetylase
VTRPERVLAFVAAHPDDDVMGAAGIVALHRDDPSFRFVLIHATDGEAGQIAVDSGVTRHGLGTVRRQEDVAGWDAVGRQPDRHEWLGLPDGGLATLTEGLLEQRIASILAEERPDVVLTFGPDGITGHPDHIAVGTASPAPSTSVRS